MQTIGRTILRSGALLLMGAVMLLAGAALAAPARSPAYAPPAALPITPCTGGTTKTCELWAKAGTAAILTTPAVIVPIWGYSTTAGGAPTLPGPALIVNQGDTVNVIVHNNLPATAGNTSLALPGQNMLPDMTG